MNVDRIRPAAQLAMHAHEGQKRKYTNEPYINHPSNVAELVAKIGGSDTMIMAAWLHDTVEDCGIDIFSIGHSFGTEVMSLVEMLTDISKSSDGNRAKRKEIDLHHTACASPDAQTIKLADLIDNSGSILQHDWDFAKVYLPEKARLLTVLTKGDKVLHRLATQIVHSGIAALRRVHS